VADVGAAPLDEMAGEFAPDPLTLLAGDVGGEAEELLVEQAKQGAERLLGAALGGGGDQDQMPVRPLRDLAD